MHYVDGPVAAVPTASRRKPIEHAEQAVCFSWIIRPTREIRNTAMEKIMQDTRLHPDHNPMPFDGVRMIFNGFDMIVDKQQ